MYPITYWGSIFNSLAPGRCGCDFKSMIFEFILQNSSLDNRCEIVVRWMPQNHTNEKSRLVQVMAWCRQATSHYLSQCWPRSISPYGVTGPQWVKHNCKVHVSEPFHFFTNWITLYKKWLFDLLKWCTMFSRANWCHLYLICLKKKELERILKLLAII